MTRENKLALIVGFLVILVVGVLVSDHFSKARQARLRDLDEQEIGSVGVHAPEFAPSEPLISDEATPIAAPRPEPARPVFANAPWSDPNTSTGLLNGALQANDRNTRQTEQRVAQRSPLDTPLLIEQGAPPTDDDVLTLSAPQASNGALINAARDRGVQIEVLAQPASIAPQTARTTPVLDTRVREPEPRDTPWEYHVRENDSLYSIAEELLGSGGRWQEIRDLNKDRLTNGNVLRIGLRLRMPDDARRSTGIDATPRRIAGAAPEPKPAAPRTRVSEYTVESGDTLGQISQRLLGTVRRMDEIIRLNSDQISDADEIRVGMTLRIPQG